LDISNVFILFNENFYFPKEEIMTFLSFILTTAIVMFFVYFLYFLFEILEDFIKKYISRL
jgi:hypothetical protein